MYLMPEAAQELGWIFLILTGISVVYGAFSACVQTDLKYINAYSSVSHCGLVLFAILMMNQTACTGAVLQMLSHGLMKCPKGMKPATIVTTARSIRGRVIASGLSWG